MFSNSSRLIVPTILGLAVALAPGGPAQADLVYVATYNDLYGTIDTSTGNFTKIGTTPAKFTTLAFAPGGQLYALADLDARAVNLYRIDATTGDSTLIGDTGLHEQPGVVQNYGLAITPDGTFYAYQSNVSSSTSGIYTLNPSNANPTLLGDAGFKSSGGMQADGLGNIYLTQGLGQGNGIYRYDPGTGNTTLLGNSDGGTAYAIAFVGETMYAFTPGGAIDRVDLTNGQSTQIATYDFGTIGVIGGAAAPSAVPEPSSVVMLGLGSLGLLGYVHRRRALAKLS